MIMISVFEGDLIQESSPSPALGGLTWKVLRVLLRQGYMRDAVQTKQIKKPTEPSRGLA